MTVAVVVPVHRNATTLEPLVQRLAAALAGRDWRVRLVVDASPDDSAAVAEGLAGDRVAVTVLARNVGQHKALEHGLREEDGATAWACLDADLQDPPEALPALLDRLERGDVDVVFAGRRGSYESAPRLLTGRLHRAVLSRLTGLPPDAGAFLALGPAARSVVLAASAPSLVAAIGAARLPAVSLPVARAERPDGTSSWTPGARLRQSARTLRWAWRARQAQRSVRADWRSRAPG
ncbi:MAG TPA: glycosyltransferase, partial [Mycobacteriales bacterium]|nr:glycosyltransferase [Mycobacteriales bacterium]